MNRAKLRICIIPSDVDEGCRVKQYNAITDGKALSTLSEIKVNKTSTGYTILYLTEDIKNMNMDILGNNIMKLFMKNLPNTMVDIEISYFHELIDEYGDISSKLELSVVNLILSLDIKFGNLNKDSGITFNYVRSGNLNKIIANVIDNYNDVIDNDDDDDDDYDSDEDDDENDEDPDVGIHNYFESFGLGGIDLGGSYDDEDDEDGDDEDGFSLIDPYGKDRGKRHKKYKESKYKESRVFHTAKNPKRAYNRHGVIICSDKEARKRDEKILKEFLKEFFPGDAEWKKEFRQDVLKRWMNMYCVTKKNLKELEKAHRKAKNVKRGNINTEKTLEFTRRLFNVPIDRWSDPSK